MTSNSDYDKNVLVYLVNRYVSLEIRKNINKDYEFITGEGLNLEN